jgi:hypothetical protein
MSGDHHEFDETLPRKPRQSCFAALWDKDHCERIRRRRRMK